MHLKTHLYLLFDLNESALLHRNEQVSPVHKQHVQMESQKYNCGLLFRSGRVLSANCGEEK